MSSESLGVALRAMGSCQVQIMLRVSDMGLRKVGDGGLAVNQELVSFEAVSFFEVGKDSDVWDFTCLMLAPDKETMIRTHVVVRGDDILLLRAASAIQGA